MLNILQRLFLWMDPIPVFGDTSVVAQIITRLAKIFLLSSAVVGDSPDHVQWSILGTWTRTTTADLLSIM